MNNQKNYTIGVNNHYNFHPSFHGEIFKILKKSYQLKNFPITNYSEPLIRSPKGSFLSKHVFSVGKFQSKTDLFFSPHILLVNTSNWVMDLEHPYWLFTDYYENVNPDSLSFKTRALIAKRWVYKDKCKFLIAWSQKSHKSMLNFFGEKISEKSTWIYPMSSLGNKYFEKRWQKKNTIRLLFIMPNKKHEEYRKGKDIVLWLIEELSKDHKAIKLFFVGYLTKEEKRRFGRLIKHTESVSRKRLFEKIYSWVDILLFPSRADTFGSAIIEAQSMGVIPIATSGKSVFSTPEMIKNGRNGFLVKNKGNPFGVLGFDEVDRCGFLKVLRELIENKNLLDKMKQNTREMFLESSFNPVNQKNKILSIFGKIITT